MDQRIVFEASKILRDVNAAEELAVKGYTIFPFLNQDDLEKLISYYTNIQKEEPNHFYSSTHSPDHSFRRESSNFIKKIVAERMEQFFCGYDLLGGAFVVKPAKGKGLLPPHQDWNIVDERITRSYNLWIPLIDVTVENGAVYVLPGSHNKIFTHRGPAIPSLFKNIEPHVWTSLEALPMKAGEALLYDHALVHASPNNNTNKMRLGIVCGIIPQNQNMQLYYGQDGEINSYKVTEDFFLDKDPNNGPEGLEMIERLKNAVVPFNMQAFDKVFMGKVANGKSNWLSKLFGDKN